MKIKKQLSTIGSVAILSLCLATGLILNSPNTTLAIQQKDVCGKVQQTGGYAGFG
ncbi:hypothetical protein H6F32_02700 [Anabaena sp. FACHB-1237]|uniref:hypothetical protein n=1 Tax=Anabaena sp. FACHB-1237 TaxID=2692769 RepID=UPI00168075E8|nr:hypothetical protein [Anabaena sp. FACHB-1237]MBD2136517.1 hypothetical protein [Anabaena sp. FACHB-1237]